MKKKLVSWIAIMVFLFSLIPQINVCAVGIDSGTMSAVAAKIGYQTDYKYSNSSIMCTAYSMAYCRAYLYNDYSEPATYWQNGTGAMWSWGGGTKTYYSSDSAELAAIKAQIDSGKPCIVRISYEYSSGHAVVAFNYSGSGTSKSDFTVIDPWSGAVRQLSYYSLSADERYIVTFAAAPTPGQPISAPILSSTKSTYSYGSQVTLNWSSVSGANGYSMYMAGKNTGVYTENMTTTSWSKVLEPDTYTVWMNAFNDTEWVASNGVTFTVNPHIQAPTLTSSKKVYSYGSQVTLNWSSVSGANGYSMYMAGKNTGVYTENINSTSWSKVLEPDTYTVWMNAFTDTEWEASNGVTFVVQPQGVIEYPDPTACPSVSTTYTDKGSYRTFNTQISNLSQSAAYVVASYDKNGKVLEITSYNNLSSGTEGCGISLPKHSGEKYVKVFLWDSINGMKPLCESEKITL